MQVFLIREIRIDVPVAIDENIHAGALTGGSDIKELKFDPQPRKIFYVMRNDIKKRDGSIKPFLQSENFIALIDIEYLTIPRNGLEFFLLLLEDVEAKWMELVVIAKSRLANIVS